MTAISRAFRTMVFALALLIAPMAMAGVNVNTASQSQLESLPGIGPSKANAIIEYRVANGAFTSLSGLDAVPGIGPATLKKLSVHVVFDGESVGVPAGSTATPNSKNSKADTPKASGETGRVNINNADQATLQSLPGIGPSKAAAIINEREANGPFEHCGQLTRVKGVGPSTAANIATRCSTQ
jgi:competence protein ComEA